AIAVSPDPVETETLCLDAGMAVTRWRCHVREAGVAATLSHKWHIIKFVHTGAFRALLREGAVHVDSTRTLLVNPREPYLVVKQFGPDVTGSAIAVSPTTIQQIVGEADRQPQTRLLRDEATPRALLMQHLILRNVEEGVSPLVVAELALTLAAEAFRDS